MGHYTEDREAEAIELAAYGSGQATRVTSTRFENVLNLLDEVGTLIDDGTATVRNAADAIAGPVPETANVSRDDGIKQPVADCTIERLEVMSRRLMEKAERLNVQARRFREQGVA